MEVLTNIIFSERNRKRGRERERKREREGEGGGGKETDKQMASVAMIEAREALHGE
jgi:hypothetical protein